MVTRALALMPRGFVPHDVLVLNALSARLQVEFTMLPEVEAIDVRVLAPPPSSRPILAGSVIREEALAARAIASPAMRLGMMGLRCRMEDGRLEPLD